MTKKHLHAKPQEPQPPNMDYWDWIQGEWRKDTGRRGPRCFSQQMALSTHYASETADLLVSADTVLLSVKKRYGLAALLDEDKTTQLDALRRELEEGIQSFQPILEDAYETLTLGPLHDDFTLLSAGVSFAHNAQHQLRSHIDLIDQYRYNSESMGLVRLSVVVGVGTLFVALAGLIATLWLGLA
ncbi:MAG: hypothetical protein RLN76_03300 [Phycisphaeraceae bacterium]